MRPLQGLQVIVTCFRGDEGTILSSSISLLPHHRDEKVPTATCCYHTALPHRLGSNHTNRLKTGNPKTVTFALHVSITLSIFHHDRKLAKSALEVKPCSHFRGKERKHHRSSPCLYSFNKHLHSCYGPISRPRQEGHGTESARHAHCALVNFFTALPPVSTASPSRASVVVSEQSPHFSPVPPAYSKQLLCHPSIQTPLHPLCPQISLKLFYGLINALRPVSPTAPNLRHILHALCPPHWLPACPLNKLRDLVFVAVVMEYHTLINL